jgi:hypothetical protein
MSECPLPTERMKKVSTLLDVVHYLGLLLVVITSWRAAYEDER